MILTPWRDKPSFIFITCSSLPGTIDAESIIVSPFCRENFVCDLFAARLRAANSSPGAGHQNNNFIGRIITGFFYRDNRTLFGGKKFGFYGYFNVCFIERPSRTIFLPKASAVFTIKASRVICEAKAAIIIRPGIFLLNFKPLVHFYFRQRESFVFNVGGISHEEKHLRFVKNRIFLFSSAETIPSTWSSL